MPTGRLRDQTNKESFLLPGQMHREFLAKGLKPFG